MDSRAGGFGCDIAPMVVDAGGFECGRPTMVADCARIGSELGLKTTIA